MTIEQAFQILGIPEISTIDEVENRYKLLIKEFHPDKETGNHEKTVSINIARTIAIKHINDLSSGLIIARQLYALVRTDNNELVKNQEYKAQSESIFNKASRKSINKYKRMQSITKLIGAFSGVLALLTSNILPIFEKFISNKSSEFSYFFTFIIFICGLAYLMLNTKTEQTKDLLEDFKESLDDKSYYYAIINSLIINSEFKNNFSRIEFENMIRLWKENFYNQKSNDSLDLIFRDNHNIPNIINLIGISDFTKLILTKGLEKDLIQEYSDIENKLHIVGYSFKINTAYSA